MAVDRWFIGGGAEHTPEAARRELYASTSGSEGVGGIADLKVLPLAVPGQGVRVTVGSALIRSKYVGGETQTYMATVYEQETVATTPTGTGETRSDLIVFRVEDPYAAGSIYEAPVEAERALAPYVFIRVIPGVPSGTTKLQDVPGYQNDTAVALARIDFPAVTGTVTAGMIKDLRNVAQPREQTTVRAFGIQGSDGEESISAPVDENWPDAAVAETNFAIDIPEWATQAVIVLTISGAKVPGGGNAGGRYWVQVAAKSDPNYFTTEQTAWDIDAASERHRVTLVTGDTRNIPAAFRGTKQRFYPKALLNSGTSARSLVADFGTTVILQVTFREVSV